MKKRSLLLVLILALLLSGCSVRGSGGKSSGITIEQVETALRQVNEDLTFTREETEEGISFSYVESPDKGFWQVDFTGTADKKGNVRTVQILRRLVPADVVTSASHMRTICSGEKVDGVDGFYDGFVALSVSDLACLHELVMSDEETPSTEQYVNFFVYDQNIKTKTGWTFSRTLGKEEKTCTIRAAFSPN